MVTLLELVSNRKFGQIKVPNKQILDQNGLVFLDYKMAGLAFYKLFLEV